MISIRPNCSQKYSFSKSPSHSSIYSTTLFYNTTITLSNTHHLTVHFHLFGTITNSHHQQHLNMALLHITKPIIPHMLQKRCSTLLLHIFKCILNNHHTLIAHIYSIIQFNLQVLSFAHKASTSILSLTNNISHTAIFIFILTQKGRSTSQDVVLQPQFTSIQTTSQLPSVIANIPTNTQRFQKNTNSFTWAERRSKQRNAISGVTIAIASSMTRVLSSLIKSLVISDVKNVERN